MKYVLATQFQAPFPHYPGRSCRTEFRGSFLFVLIVAGHDECAFPVSRIMLYCKNMNIYPIHETKIGAGHSATASKRHDAV
jgi:hypothetical protein